MDKMHPIRKREYGVGTYKTRSGIKAVVLGESPSKTHPLVGYIIDDDPDYEDVEVEVESWTREGFAFRNDDESGLDLMSDAIEIVAIAVINHNRQIIGIFNTFSAAEDFSRQAEGRKFLKMKGYVEP